MPFTPPPSRTRSAFLVPERSTLVPRSGMEAPSHGPQIGAGGPNPGIVGSSGRGVKQPPPPPTPRSSAGSQAGAPPSPDVEALSAKEHLPDRCPGALGARIRRGTVRLHPLCRGTCTEEVVVRDCDIVEHVRDRSTHRDERCRRHLESCERQHGGLSSS